MHPGKVVAGSINPTDFDLVVNATPLGMRTDDPLPMEVAKLTRSTFVADVVTSPEITPLHSRLAATSKRALPFSQAP